MLYNTLKKEILEGWFMTGRLICALLVGFATAVLVGYFYIPWLRRMKAGQEIREDGPKWHQSKAGTPTMGGVIFIVAVAVTVFTAGFPSIRKDELGAVYVLLFAVFFGAIGFLDDYKKVQKKQNLGLSARAKFLLQVLAAAALLALLRMEGYLKPELYVPFFNCTWELPVWLYYILAIFIVVGTVNSVNLTDGVDGLAAGTSVPVFLFYTAAAFVSYKIYGGESGAALGVFCAGLTGGLFGFLIYNFHPARVFMGDTGSLFLGGAVCGMAFASDMPLILIPLGIMFILETMSDLIQVSYFKLTHGKRVFRMAPFHHHLEMGGWLGHRWKETQIFALFVSVTFIMAVVSFLAVLKRAGL